MNHRDEANLNSMLNLQTKLIRKGKDADDEELEIAKLLIEAGYRLCVTVWGCVWLSVAMCGCLWLCVAVCGCVWLSVVVFGCVWLCVDLCGCVMGSV